MADPRKYTVKQCPPAYAAKSGASIGQATSIRRDFFNSVGKVGDLEVLNSVGGGSIGKGLRNLASISNSIRTGCGALPSSIGNTIDSGANWVLEHTGIAPATVDALRNFNPGIANQAYGQAKTIFQQVQQGTFKSTDIPGYLQDLQNLERLGRNIFTPGRGDKQESLGGHCEASPYAVDLIARAPKFKFLFIVEFIPNPAYTALTQGGVPVLEMAFTVKSSTRPNIKFHTEDVNYYNYRSKYITKTMFDDMKMTFYDDIRNAATQFYTTYLNAISPISNIDPMTGASHPGLLQQQGMGFYDEWTGFGSTTQIPGMILDQIPGNRYAASVGPLAATGDSTQTLVEESTVFNQIRLYHVFDYGNRMTVYNFANPRVTELSPDDVDMASGEGSELSVVFSYDTVFVDPDVDLKTSTKYGNIRDKQRNAIYQLQYNGAGNPGGPNNSGINPTGQPAPTTPSCDPVKKVDTSAASLVSTGSAAVAAVADLSTKFSKLV